MCRPLLLLSAALGLLGASAPRARVAEESCPRQAALEGQNTFGCELYQRLVRDGPGQNVLVSPTSLYGGLAMLYAGARGDTARQMACALAFTLPRRELARALAEVSRERACALGPGATLRAANALWVHKDLDLRPGFARLLKEDFQAPIRQLDFAADPSAARDAINRWASEQTQGEVPRLLDRLDRTTLLVAANAVYFRADWKFPFDPKKTGKGKFTRADGRQAEVVMMNQARPLPYFRGKGFGVVALPYAGGELAMLVALPDRPDGLPELDKALSPAAIASWVKEMTPRNVYLKFPKFSTRSAYELSGPLKDMGMSLAFSDRADFTGIEKGGGVHKVDQVVHRAVVRVDERGTKAAAGTGVVTVRDRVVFEADRPFLFLVRDMKSGEVLFLGRLVAPE